MNKIPSLRKGTSLVNDGQATLIQSRVVSSIMSNYMDLSVQDASNNISNILVFPNKEYVITFYDSKYGAVRSVNGLVVGIWDDQIKMRYVNEECDQIQCCTCSDINCAYKRGLAGSGMALATYMPTCNCVKNTGGTSKYNSVSAVYIPTSNIITVNTPPSSDGSCDCNNGCKEPPKFDPKESEHKVMVLGISASVVRAIVVHLEFIDDSIEEALKYVDLAVGNTYNVSYEVNKTHGCHDHQTIYEITGKLVRIEEVNFDNDKDCHCRNGKGFVRENVGLDGSIYTCCYNSKEEFLKAPPIGGIKLVFDTSETFYGRYETIMISSIRDCTLVATADQEGSEGSDNTNCGACENCAHKTPTCNPYNCIHCAPPPIPAPDCGHCNKEFHRVYDYRDDMIKAEIDGDKVSVMHKGVAHEVTLEEVMRVYLGI